MRLDVRRVSHAIGDLPILKDVSFSVAPGELVGILGPSGSGKSTLFKVLTGLYPLAQGCVLFDGSDLSLEGEGLRHRIGYVPQEDIVHATLTVREVLRFAAALRLSRDLPADDVLERIHDVLASVGLEGTEESEVRSLSGGQRKRVSLAVELLTRPAILLLDEPTSGLDPANEARAMETFRRIADEGRTVLVSTHVIENLGLLDRVAVLSQGRLVFFGPPGALLSAFEVARVPEVYERLRERSAAEWEAEFRASALHETEVRARLALCPLPSVAPAEAEPRRAQLPTLTLRYLLSFLRDRRNLILLVAQAPVIAACIAMAHDAGTQAGNLGILFDMSIAAVWFGCINACREIVKERAILERERMVGVDILPYAASKVAVLALVCAVQTALLLGVVCAWERLPGEAALYGVVLFASAVSSLALGLLVSSVVDTSDKAISLVPIVLIPQLIFVDVAGASSGFRRRIETFTLSKWAYQGVRDVLERRSIAPPLGMLALFAVALLAGTIGALAWKGRR